jgi:hypothetical protein
MTDPQLNLTQLGCLEALQNQRQACRDNEVPAGGRSPRQVAG